MSLPPNPSEPANNRELDRTSALLERYLLEPDLRATDPDLRAFAASHPHLIRVTESLRASWQGTFDERTVNMPPIGEARTESAAAVVLPAVDPSLNAPHTPHPWTPATNWTRFRSRALPLALGAIAFVVGGGGIWTYVQQSRQAGSQNAANEFVTHRGERTRVQLADGSTVILAPDSRLKIVALRSNVREVILEGEGYFSAHGREDAPFIVRAGHGIVRVLGTEFAVRHYSADSTVRVAVANGRVSFGSRTGNTPKSAQPAPDNSETILNASDIAILGADRRVQVSRGVSVDDYIAWRTGELRFKDVPVSKLLAELGRAYDVNFQVPDSALARLRVSATFRDMSTDGMIELLSLLLNTDARRQGQSVTLIKKTAE